MSVFFCCCGAIRHAGGKEDDMAPTRETLPENPRTLPKKQVGYSTSSFAVFCLDYTYNTSTSSSSQAISFPPFSPVLQYIQKKKLFDRQMIGLWLSKQGSICPLTGQPLVEAELKPDDKARAEAKAWNKDLLASKRQQAAGGRTTSSGAGRTTEAREGAGAGSGQEGRQTGKPQTRASTDTMAKASPSSSSSQSSSSAGGGGGVDPAGPPTAGRSRSSDADDTVPGAAPAKGVSGERRGSKESDSDDIYDF